MSQHNAHAAAKTQVLQKRREKEAIFVLPGFFLRSFLQAFVDIGEYLAPQPDIGVVI